ncbi:hypothetical protein [Streptomyces aureoversilis]|uniref:Uncharacterized protein n=1 Tax=Streptomyces aureoversilis TaxID=67277 RepID=A0ABV9ZU13_9ACTN
MSDIYELQLALDLPDTLPETDIAVLGRHLSDEGGYAGGDADRDEPDEEAGGPETYPLLASRGPAWRIGGALVGELCRGPRGWALTARQEVHPDEFPALEALLVWLAARTSTPGPIGYLRFYESTVPDVLMTDGQVPCRMSLHPSAAVEPELLPGAV